MSVGGHRAKRIPGFKINHTLCAILMVAGYTTFGLLSPVAAWAAGMGLMRAENTGQPTKAYKFLMWISCVPALFWLTYTTSLLVVRI